MLALQHGWMDGRVWGICIYIICVWEWVESEVTVRIHFLRLWYDVFTQIDMEKKKGVFGSEGCGEEKNGKAISVCLHTAFYNIEREQSVFESNEQRITLY